MNARRSNTPSTPRPLAAEYALGALEAKERREAERRIAEEPAFREEVERWQEHFAPLNDQVAEVRPPEAVWKRIAAELGHAEVPSSGLWNSLGFWRLTAAGACALAIAALVGLAALPRAAPPADEALVATLSAAGEQPAFVARLDPRSHVLAVRLVGASGGDARVPELWIIPGDGVPRSLGLVSGASAALTVAPEHRGFLREGGVLAISLEPPGGSPTGRPTGPVIASGRLLAL